MTIGMQVYICYTDHTTANDVLIMHCLFRVCIVNNYMYYCYTCLVASFQDNLGKPLPER